MKMETEPGEGASGWPCECARVEQDERRCAAALYKAGRAYSEIRVHDQGSLHIVVVRYSAYWPLATIYAAMNATEML
jgi:hypothetical protein